MAIVICLIALAFISITMFARANDIKWDGAWHSHVRRFGLVLSGSAPIGIAASFLHAPPTIYQAAFYVGLMCVFFTTPGQVPWWRFISKGCQHG
jgi:hypothetical protein